MWFRRSLADAREAWCTPAVALVLACCASAAGGVSVAFAGPHGAATAQTPEAWPYLPIGDVGAVTFRRAHPTWDGRGVVIAILDTGVDAFAPGLGVTSTGQPKLIDARDFSTEGDWELVEAERDTTVAPGVLEFKHPESGFRLAGAERLAVPPVPGDAPAGRIYITRIPESRFTNSGGGADLNDDGDAHDTFGVLVYLAERSVVEQALGHGRGYTLLEAIGDDARRAVAREREAARVWLAAVDTDGDGRLDDERPLRDYHVNHDTFKLCAPDAPAARTMMAWCLNVVEEAERTGRPRPPRLELHFDNGAHGSHCAGIAAGYRVGGQDGLDGVAPGAWLMSLKIGDNRLAGGATRTESMKKAVHYLADFAKRYGVPVVVNMSYGVAAVEEGDDAIGRFLDEELPKHPQVYFCTSAGNEGPGISTVGLPATAASVIASGAYLSPSAAEALYNARLTRPTLFAFSSRGGETPKPDVVAPGAALSTVPGWQDGTGRFNGTSMASPTTAGAVACLLSGALQEGLATHWGMIKRALIFGGTEVPGLARTEQGGGLVNLLRSWELLVQLARSVSAHKVLDYRVETASPSQFDGVAAAAYWRTPDGVPIAPEVVTFRVTPVFHPDLSPDDKDTFFRSFALRSEAGWLKVVSGRRYLRGKAPLEIDVQYDASRTQQQGLHSARVIASLDGGDLTGAASQEFTLWNTIVTPDVFGPEKGFSRKYTGRDLAPSSVHRYYVAVPAGASALRVRLEVSERTGADKGARVLTEICDPDGAVRGGYAGYASVDGVQIRDQTVLPPELRPGIWEINVVSAISAMAPGAYYLTVSFDGYQVEPTRLTDLPRADTGETATATLEVTRVFPGVFKGDVQAALTGFGREQTITVEEADVWTRDFTLDRAAAAAEFRLRMDKATANLLTDCAVNILDAEGRHVVTDSFLGLEAHVTCRLPTGADKAAFTLEVVAGFALAADMASWSFELEELYEYATPVVGKVRRAARGVRGNARDAAGDNAGSSGEGPVLYCGVPIALDIAFAGAWPQPPSGMAPRGVVRFLDRNAAGRAPGDTDGQLILEVPIALKP